MFLSSCYLGLKKPDGEIYRLAAAITNCPPRRCLFIDDRAVNVESAAAAGMDGIQYRDVEQLTGQLRDLGVTP